MNYEADRLLMQYAESLALLSAANTHRITIVAGRPGALFCATTDCDGSPREHSEGWFCTSCNKRWPVEEVEIPKNAVMWSRPSPGEGLLRIRLVEFGRVLEHVRRMKPWPFAAWTLHHLAEGPVHPGATVPTLGVSLDRVREILIDYREREVLPDPRCEITQYRVGVWRGEARAAVMRFVRAKGL